MTVGELIEQLQVFPDDIPVMLGVMPISEVYLDENFFFADSKNPATAVGPAIVIE